jgi:hypothetical protein
LARGSVKILVGCHSKAPGCRPVLKRFGPFQLLKEIRGEISIPSSAYIAFSGQLSIYRIKHSARPNHHWKPWHWQVFVSHLSQNGRFSFIIPTQSTMKDKVVGILSRKLSAFQQ